MGGRDYPASVSTSIYLKLLPKGLHQVQGLSLLLKEFVADNELIITVEAPDATGGGTERRRDCRWIVRHAGSRQTCVFPAALGKRRWAIV